MTTPPYAPARRRCDACAMNTVTEHGTCVNCGASVPDEPSHHAPRPFSVLRGEVLADPERAARVEQIKENVMIEVEKYQAKAAAAADALRAALIAVEECGADVELTNIVMHLGDDRTKLCRLFGLPPEQAHQVEQLAAREQRMVKVAVGLDYETDSPWVWTGDKVEEDCDDESGWFVVEVPEPMADRFKAAITEADEATKAIHEHAGYDRQWSRLGQACAEFTAEPVIVGGRTYHDDCDRCGWKKEDHRGS